MKDLPKLIERLRALSERIGDEDFDKPLGARTTCHDAASEFEVFNSRLPRTADGVIVFQLPTESVWRFGSDGKPQRSYSFKSGHALFGGTSKMNQQQAIIACYSSRVALIESRKRTRKRNTESEQ